MHPLLALLGRPPWPKRKSNTSVVYTYLSTQVLRTVVYTCSPAQKMLLFTTRLSSPGGPTMLVLVSYTTQKCSVCKVQQGTRNKVGTGTTVRPRGADEASPPEEAGCSFRAPLLLVLSPLTR